MTEQKLWEQCVAFHGHTCGGLAIGFQAALYAKKLLELTGKEEVACICENDACSIDGIQMVLGCTVGRGNLLFHLTGKQVYSMYNRTTGKSVRLVLRDRPAGMSREEAFRWYRDSDPEVLFDVQSTVLALPERGAPMASQTCDCCGEMTGEKWLRLVGDRKVCIDCYETYDRFSV